MKLLYLGDRDRLALVDVTELDNPRWLSEFRLPHSPRIVSLAYRSSYLYLATRENDGARLRRLQVLDISTAAALRLIWSSAPQNQIGTLEIAEHLLFAASGASVSIYNIDQPEPLLSGIVPTLSQVRALTMGPEALYVAESTAGLTVIQTGPLINPTHVISP